MDSATTTRKPPIVEYVVGFFFDTSGEKVVLIRKNRPVWQAGSLNGVGGHVEKGETPMKAMTREFEEETGVRETNWRHFAIIRGATFVVHFFEVHSRFPVYKSLTDEEVLVYNVEHILQGSYKMIPNLFWLIPLANDKDKVVAEVFDPSAQ